MGRLFGDFTIKEPYAVQNTEVTRRGALLAVAASAALSIGAWAEPIRPRLIDEIGEATFTSLSRFRPGRDGVERLSVSVQTVDEQQRPVKFLLPNGVQSEIFYEENGEQRAVEFVVPAGLRADGRKRRVNTTYLLFQLNPSVEKGAVRIQHGNRYTDLTTDAAGRYTHLTYGVIQGQKVYSPDDEDCDWSCMEDLALGYLLMGGANGPGCTGLCGWAVSVLDCNFVNSCAEDSADMDSCLGCCRSGGNCPLIIKVFLTSACNANCAWKFVR